MNHTKRKKKKKRPASRNSNPDGTDAARGKQEEGNRQQKGKEIDAFVEAVGSVSVGDVTLRDKAVKGLVNEAPDIWGYFLDSSDDPSTSSVSGSSTSELASASWSGSGTGSSEGFLESGCLQDVVSNGKGGRKYKRVAATGTVSTVLGKDYVGASPRRRWKEGGNDNASVGKEDAEQFLYSMLGNDCQLSMAVVRDVLCERSISLILNNPLTLL